MLPSVLNIKSLKGKGFDINSIHHNRDLLEFNDFQDPKDVQNEFIKDCKDLGKTPPLPVKSDLPQQ